MTDGRGLQQIDLGDVRLNVFERGAGPALLLVHGFPLDHTMWTWQLDALSANNRLIAHRNHGSRISGCPMRILAPSRTSSNSAKPSGANTIAVEPC